MHSVWNKRRLGKISRLESVQSFVEGKIIQAGRLVDVFENIIHPGDKVVLEGDNQKQADYLSRTLVRCDVAKLYDLHVIMSCVSCPEHLDLFERGLATKLDFAYAGPQSLRIGSLIEAGKITVNAIHTYIELYARLYVDLIPNVVLICALQADRNGNLYTGPNTEDTPVITEAAAFHNGIVIAQVNEIVDSQQLRRVDIPADWVDLIVVADQPYSMQPLFTRDPQLISDSAILKAMLAIRGIYERHEVTSLNHGIGFDTAAIELILPTYGDQLGLKGKIAKNWVLNPHPTMIPAIESGWVESITCPGSEQGMERYIAARSDVFFTGNDGSLRSNRLLAQLAGQYAIDMFIGSTLQMDKDGNSSTVTDGRLTGFGGAPNLGHDPHGRRRPTPTWLNLAYGESSIIRGKKLVVQIAQTVRRSGTPTFVDSLDAVSIGEKMGMPIAPVMIYGDDVTHIVTEVGVAYLYKTTSIFERREAIAAIAGETEIGTTITSNRVNYLRTDGIVAYPEDLGINTSAANRSLLAAQNINDLVDWSHGLYDPPAQFQHRQTS